MGTKEKKQGSRGDEKINRFGVKKACETIPPSPPSATTITPFDYSLSNLDGSNRQLERPRGEVRVELPVQLELGQHELERVYRVRRERGRVLHCRGSKVVPAQGKIGRDRTGQDRTGQDNDGGLKSRGFIDAKKNTKKQNPPDSQLSLSYSLSGSLGSGGGGGGGCGTPSGPAPFNRSRFYFSFLNTCSAFFRVSVSLSICVSV